MLPLVSRNYEAIKYDTRSGVWPAPCARFFEDRALYYCKPTKIVAILGGNGVSIKEDNAVRQGSVAPNQLSINESSIFPN